MWYRVKMLSWSSVIFLQLKKIGDPYKGQVHSNAKGKTMDINNNRDESQMHMPSTRIWTAKPTCWRTAFIWHSVKGETKGQTAYLWLQGVTCRWRRGTVFRWWTVLYLDNLDWHWLQDYMQFQKSQNYTEEGIYKLHLNKLDSKKECYFSLIYVYCLPPKRDTKSLRCHAVSYPKEVLVHRVGFLVR